MTPDWTTWGKNLVGSRDALLSLLTEEERKTERTRGSSPPVTFEDHARKISEDFDDPRIGKVHEALVNYQYAVNTIWEWALTSGLINTQAKKWLEMRKVQLNEACATFDDALSEAILACRRAVRYWDPDRQFVFSTYSHRIVIQALDRWWARQQAPVELPENVAFKREHSRVSYDDIITEKEDSEDEW